MGIPADLAAYFASKNRQQSKPASSGGRNPAQQRSGAPASAGTRRPVAPSPAPEPVRSVQIGGGGRAPTETLQDWRAAQAATVVTPSLEPAPEPAPESSAPAAAPAPAPASAPAAAEPAPDTTVENAVAAMREEMRLMQQQQREEQQINTYRQLEAYLSDIGLGSLLRTDANGNPTGWLWDQIKKGISSAAALEIALRETPEFQNRFGIIIEQQRRAGQGENVQVMSPAEVLAYEREVTQVFRTAGLPSTFYDTYDELHSFLRADLSGADVVNRIETAFNYVASAPDEVRAKFEEFYGVGQGDIALATYVLDPQIALSELEKSTRTAYTAGMGERYEIRLARAQAERIAEMPMTEAGIVEGLQQIAGQSPLFTESVGEAVDLTAEETGVAAVFEGSGEARTQLERRLTARQAINRASVGGAVTTAGGVVGLGVGN